MDFISLLAHKLTTNTFAIVPLSKSFFKLMFSTTITRTQIATSFI
jgi:hypothetical protein